MNPFNPIAPPKRCCGNCQYWDRDNAQGAVGFRSSQCLFPMPFAVAEIALRPYEHKGEKCMTFMATKSQD